MFLDAVGDVVLFAGCGVFFADIFSANVDVLFSVVDVFFADVFSAIVDLFFVDVYFAVVDVDDPVAMARIVPAKGVLEAYSRTSIARVTSQTLCARHRSCDTTYSRNASQKFVASRTCDCLCDAVYTVVRRLIDSSQFHRRC